jgi:hypothetical protein
VGLEDNGNAEPLLKSRGFVHFKELGRMIGGEREKKKKPALDMQELEFHEAQQPTLQISQLKIFSPDPDSQALGA